MNSHEEALPLLHLGVRNSNPITVDVAVPGKTIEMEVDTGAAVSFVTEQQQQELFPTAVLCHRNVTCVTLRTYTVDRLPVVGEIHVHVQYSDQTSDLPLLVVRGVGPALLGRDWLQHIRLDWARTGMQTAIRQLFRHPDPLQLREGLHW